MGDQRVRSPEEIEELRERLRSYSFWYHNIDLGDGIRTNPDHPHGDYPASRWKVIEPWIPDDCSGSTVLDIGCNAGFFSIEFKKRGAAYVLGVDELPEVIDQARLVASETGHPDIDYRCMSVYDLDRLVDVPSRFDFVVFLGLFYHLRHPLLMLDKVSGLSPRRMYFQTVLRGARGSMELQPDYPIEEHRIFDDPRYPALYFVERKFAGDPTNWWMANESCVLAMLRSAGFTEFQRTDNPEIIICGAPTHRPGVKLTDR